MSRLLFLIPLLLCLTFMSAFAQQEGFQTVRMQLIDSATHKPVAYAAILVYAEGQKEASRFGVSDEEGFAEISRLTKGKYLISIEHLTYSTVLKFISTQKKRTTDLGQILLVERPVGLEEAVVKGEGPVVQKGDTTEYNARFFNPAPNEYLGDLMKKMPGLEIIGNQIFFKGKKVESLTVEGRPFFSADKGIALENLPAYTVKKVQVFRKKRRMLSGLEDRANTPMEVNIVLKDDMKSGLVGNLTPGYGTDSRFLMKGLLGRFGRKATTACIVSANNLSKEAGSGTSYSFGANGYIMPQVPGRSAGEEGDVRTLLGGIDYARGGGLDGLVYLNATWRNTDRHILSAMQRETSLSDGLLNYRSDEAYDSRTDAGGLNFRKNIFLDRSDRGQVSLNIMTHLFLNYDRTRDSRQSHFTSVRDSLENAGSKGNSTYGGELESGSVTGGFSLERYTRRSSFSLFSLRLDFGLSRYGHDYRNFSRTTSGPKPPVIRDMKKENNRDKLHAGAGLRFRLPGDLTLNYGFRFNNEISDAKAWEVDSLTGRFEGLSEASTGRTRNTEIIQDLELARYFTFKTLHGKKTAVPRYLTLSLTLRPLWKETSDKGFSDIYRKWDLIPLIHYRGVDDRFEVKYTGDISHPSIRELQPVLNDDNPLYIVRGNPDLHPSYTHKFTLKKAISRFSLNADFSSTQDRIIRKQGTDEDGVTRSMPVNADGDWRAGLGVHTVSIGVARHLALSGHVSGRYVRGIGYQGDEKYTSDNWTANSSLGLTYRKNYFDFTLSASLNWSDSRFSTRSLEGESSWIKGLAGRMNWALPFGFTLLSDFSCSWYSGFRSDEKPSAVWNAEICKSVFGNRMILSAKGFDLLDKTRNLKTSYADNYVEERTANVLRRFVLFSLSYKFGKF